LGKFPPLGGGFHFFNPLNSPPVFLKGSFFGEFLKRGIKKNARFYKKNHSLGGGAFKDHPGVLLKVGGPFFLSPEKVSLFRRGGNTPPQGGVSLVRKNKTPPGGFLHTAVFLRDTPLPRFAPNSCVC